MHELMENNKYIVNIRPFQDVSNQPIDEICCTYTHKNWKNGLEYWIFKCLDRAQVLRKIIF